MLWIKNNTLAIDASFDEELYSALTGESNICEYGGKKKIVRWNNGLVNCGRADKCLCSKNKLQTNLANARDNFTEDTKQRIKTKRENTMLQKYGCKYNSEREEVKVILRNNKHYENKLNKLKDKDWLREQLQTYTVIELAIKMQIFYGTINEYTKLYKIRTKSTTYNNTLNEIGTFVDKLLIDNEIIDDTLVMDTLKVKTYNMDLHSYNTDRYLIQKDVVLNNTLYVLDYDWHNKNEIIKNILRSKLDKNENRIYARKCEIRAVNKEEEKQFLEKWHRQGYVASYRAVGLYYEDELVCLVSIGKNRFNTGCDWELLRLCSTGNTTVVGGASKLMKNITANIKGEIVSFCTLDYAGKNSAYEAIGFEFVSVTAPSYFWTDGKNVIISRYKAQNYKKWLLTYDENLGIVANMKAAGYRQCWTGGNYKFIYRNSYK